MDFKKPDFSKGDVELRFENGVVCIYATENGLKRIADLCLKLVEHPGQGHMHLEEYQLLTNASKKGAIAIFGEKCSG